MAVDERRMDQVVGSGNHSRIYVTLHEGRFYQMPVAWYSQARVWDLAPGFEHNNLFFSREITAECTFCHNAVMEPVAGTRNAYAGRTPDGIDCERCHGPGRLHVEKWSSPEPETGSTPADDTAGIDPSIVNPRHLPLHLRRQVCYQCHLGGSETSERLPRDGRSPYVFRPGTSLLEAMLPYGYEQPLGARFNVTGQVDRMILSRCFTASGGRLECLTCHNPHVTVYREDRPPDHFRRACLTCHQEPDCTATHEARQATSPPDDCVTCHMRRAEPSDHKHATFIDHWIRRTIDVDPVEKRTDYRFVPILPETSLVLGEAALESHRGRAALLKAFQAETPPLAARLRQEAEASFRAAVDKGADDADTWYFRGKNLTYIPRWEEAAAAFRKALERRPGYREAALDLAGVLLNQQRPAEAAAVYRKLDEEQPGDPAVLADLGRCELALGRPREALALFEAALEKDPLRGSLHANRAAALAALTREGEAAAAASRALALEPQNRMFWAFFSELLTALGRLDEAAEANRQVRRQAGGPAAAP
jgi:Flp pilus assembly protein TadD